MSVCCTVEQIEDYVAGRSTDEAVTRHIESCEQCRANAARVRENNELVAELAKTVIPASSGAPRPAPDSIEGYEILGEIHRGGQGIVYKAVQKATHRTVALKVLSEGAFASPKQRYRFEREIDLVAHLNHPNIVTLYDSGETADGRQYFAMEHIHGVPLDRYLGAAGFTLGAGDRKSLKRRLRLFAAICAGVNHAHQRGVTHRDLKPGNILIDASGQPHIVDFGLAKAPGAVGSGELAPMTMTGEFMGTLAYAAPEQLKGDPALIDTRTDVYALGVVLYEVLTGRRPHPAEGSMMDVLKAITDADPAPPSRAALARAERPRKLKHAAQVATGIDSVHERINDELDTIVLKALAKDKDRRYQTADALRVDIERYLAGEAIEAKRDSSWYVLTKTLKRHKAPVGVFFGIMALLIVFGITMSIMYSEQVRQTRRADRNAEKANNVSSFVQELFSFASPFEDTTGAAGQVALRDAVDYAARRLTEEPGREPQVQATLLTTIGEVYVDLGFPKTAKPLLESALQIREQELGPDDPEVVDSLMKLGEACEKLSDYSTARTLYTRAQEITERRAGRQGEAFADATAHLADALVGDDPATAERLYQEALQIQRAVYGPNHPEVAITLDALAEVYESTCPEGALCDEPKAEQCYREALRIREAAFPAGHPRVIESLNNFGLFLSYSDPEAAATLLERADRTKSSLLDHHPYAAGILSNLGYVLQALDDADGAEKQYRRAIEIWEKIGRHEDPGATVVHHELAHLLRNKGELQEAEVHFRKCLALLRELGANDALDPAAVLLYLADLLREMKRYEEAAPLADEAIRKLQTAESPDRVHLGSAMRVRGRVALALNKPAEALPLLRKCFELWREELGEADDHTVAVALNLGDCLIALGKLDEAETVLLTSFEAVRARDVPSPLLADLEASVVRVYQGQNRPDKAAEYRATSPE